MKRISGHKGVQVGFAYNALCNFGRLASHVEGLKAF